MTTWTTSSTVPFETDDNLNDLLRAFLVELLSIIYAALCIFFIAILFFMVEDQTLSKVVGLRKNIRMLFFLRHGEEDDDHNEGNREKQLVRKVRKNPD